MRPNIGWLFYKKLYEKGDNQNHIADVSKEILKSNIKDEPIISKYKHGFELTTTYPGLLIGSGYIHGISSDNDFKIGFYFDHTSGLPVIPGSSIKGVLRSLFALPFNKKEDPYKKEKEEIIRSFLKRDKNFDVKALALTIFEGIDPENQKPMSIYERDIFYEARVVQTNGKLLNDDYITPHKDQLKNPIPLRFLKVAPKTTFAFSFRLTDTTINGDTVTAEEKEELFFKLLTFHGIGAKTNVGYGQFEEIGEDAYEQKKRTYLQRIENILETERKKREKKALEEKLESMPEHEKLFEKHKNNIPELIRMMQNKDIEERYLKPLAQLIKQELMKNQKTWKKAKQKALKRKEYIESILNN